MNSRNFNERRYVISLIKLIIFDCDGVLVDSQAIINKIEWEYISFLGVPISFKKFNERFSGEKARTIVERLKDEDHIYFPEHLNQIAEFIDAAVLHRLTTTHKLKPIKGVKKLLQNLVPKKCVASNCSSKLLKVILTAGGLLPYFGSDVFSFERVERPKPYPDLFLYAARSMGENPEQCLVIEDSVAGVKAAVAAGMTVIGFVGGSHVTQSLDSKLMNTGASNIFKNMESLSLFLQKNHLTKDSSNNLMDKIVPHEYVEERQLMVQHQLKERGIYDFHVLKAMEKVPRHLFVPKDLQHMAYSDTALPIGYDQTISQPYIVALMCQNGHLSPADKVLEIGTGSGYQAAVLSLLAKDIYTIEIVKPLLDVAKERFEKQGYKNIHSKEGDGYLGWKENAPYDVIFVTAVVHEVPFPLIEQLKLGGCIIMPLIKRAEQWLVCIKKTKEGLTERLITPVTFVPLI